MSYTVLARRYRSRDFDEVVGQEPIVKTLQNAIAADRTAHAYLFCGTRGVGKTSMARIFARALNATTELEQSGEIADAILRGEDLDVIEIDGASNRGVQEARDLIAAAGLCPARCTYRIYIIDEVHMLTTAAFNTLLKTMEEPPPHVKFILCTTEPNQVPATIQSRCQRFDFRPLSTTQIADHLRAILVQEDITADDEVSIQVARLGHGSMRDALSLLDRLMAGGEKNLTVELLEQTLGLPDQTLISGIIDAIIARDAAAALTRGAALLDTGLTVEQALELLTRHIRTLLLMATCGAETDLLDVAADARRVAAEQAASFDPPGLVHMIAVCDAVARNARGASTARALFDAVMVRLCLSHQLADLASVIAEGRPAIAAAKPTSAVKKKEGHPHEPEPLSEPEAAAMPPVVVVTSVAATKTPELDTSPAVSSAVSPLGSPSVTEIKPPEPPADDTRDIWPVVMEFASRSRGDLARVEHLEFRSLDDRTLHLGVDEAGASIARYLSKQTDQIADLVKRATGRKVKVVIDLGEHGAPRRHTVNEDLVQKASELPAVARAMELFDATIVDVHETVHKTVHERGDQNV